MTGGGIKEDLSAGGDGERIKGGEEGLIPPWINLQHSLASHTLFSSSHFTSPFSSIFTELSSAAREPAHERRFQQTPLIPNSFGRNWVGRYLCQGPDETVEMVCCWSEIRVASLVYHCRAFTAGLSHLPSAKS